ncbi:hypothetical protein KIN20_004631 [Parelaphostrongylus tenuis]|uniref:Uncharacterized protein n=1 Tax=Parelaphostrongylus tenuis TaxID=148309 RepID=A0AAD5QI45_PARTN|nr:hypothetical protein KIN20_004631 [Parelaphostrongylus tenuis]
MATNCSYYSNFVILQDGDNMNNLIEFFQRLKRKLSFSQLTPNDRKPNSTGTQNVNETRQRSRTTDTSSVVVRPRSETEISIQRNLCKDRPHASQTNICDSSKGDRMNKKKLQKDKAVEQRRTRAHSAPVQPFIISRRSDPIHLNLISTGSILAPRYRSRTATLGKYAVVRLTIQ